MIRKHKASKTGLAIEPLFKQGRIILIIHKTNDMEAGLKLVDAFDEPGHLAAADQV